MWCRYKHLHDKFVVHPLDGRKVPIIQDAELVDMSFGTGAVKITPAHDPNDFATGKRHNLQCINILDDDGRINAHGGQFAGQPRFQVTIPDAAEYADCKQELLGKNCQIALTDITAILDLICIWSFKSTVASMIALEHR